LSSWLLLLGCHEPAVSDALVDGDGPLVLHTGEAIEPHTGTVHSAAVPQLHSAGLIDSGFVPLRSDSGGPTCVPTVARNRAVLTGWTDPALSPECDVVPSSSVGRRRSSVAWADDVARGRIDGTRMNDTCGLSVLMVGDQDGDGVGEYVVGCKERGDLMVFEGMPMGTLTRRDAETVVHLYGETTYYVEQGALLGPSTHALAVAGQFNTTTYVLPLPLPQGEWEADEVAAGTVIGNHYDTRGGVVSVGDWNADGTDDLAVAGIVNGPDQGSGGVNLLFGPVDSDRDPVAAELVVEVGDQDVSWASDVGSSGIWSRALLPDLTGDGYPELALGGEFNRNLVPPFLEAIPLHGGVWLFDGGPGAVGTLGAADARAHLYGACGATWDAYMFRSVGDVTGDCLPDIAAGSALFDLGDGGFRGAVFVLSELRRVRGTLPLSKAATAIILGENPGDQLYSVGFVGDWNLDGFDELVVGARDPGGLGKVYVFLGPVSGTWSAAYADLILTDGDPWGVFGEELRGGRDLDGDGVPDLLVGAPGSSVSGLSASGSVYVFSGADLLAEM
jgi:hypothetical protein